MRRMTDCHERVNPTPLGSDLTPSRFETYDIDALTEMKQIRVSDVKTFDYFCQQIETGSVDLHQPSPLDNDINH